MKKPIFERQQGESIKAFEAFAKYRDMGAERTQKRVGTELVKSMTIISRWSHTFNWVERAKEYDAHLDRKSILEDEKKRKEMVKRHASQAMMFQSKVLDRMTTLKPEELSPNDLIKWFTEAVKIERLSRGQSTEISEVTHSGEVKQENDIFQRVEQYAEVYKKMADSRATSGIDESDDN